MARPCTVCEHPRLSEINRAWVDSAADSPSKAERFRRIGGTYGLHPDALRRHVASHMTEGLARAVVKHAELVEETKQLDVLGSLGRAAAKLEKFLDAADSWLRDPANPDAYDLSPRDHEVLVVWERQEERADGTRYRVKRKERLTEILRRCAGESSTAPDPCEIVVIEANHGNPRKLILDAMAAGKPLLELLGKATGQLRPDPTVTLNVFFESKEWQQVESTLLESLRPYPLALEAAGRALAAIEGVGDAR